jgi:hypothetical protein
MKQKMNLPRTLSTGSLLTLIVFAGFLPVKAQTLTAQACVQPNHQAATATLVQASSAGETSVSFDMPIEVANIVINPGGATEERFTNARRNAGEVVLGFTTTLAHLAHAHSEGETVIYSTEVDVVVGYTNTSNVTLNVPRGVSSNNFFTPGPLLYPGQPSQFLPGVHGNVFTIKLGAIPPALSWALNNNQFPITNNIARCGTITYQGRLNHAGAAANGNYELRFVAYDTATNGTAQGDPITVNQVVVTNGTFTVPLFFANTFTNNAHARFLEIGVRPDGGSGGFTIMAPRQPITDVPYAIYSQTALNATNAINATNALDAQMLGGATADQYLKNNTSGTINGNFHANGDVIVDGTITSGCRPGFLAIVGGRLCVSSMQEPATFYGFLGAVETCRRMNARVGNSADAMLTFTTTIAFDYFRGATQGWLADHFGDNTWGTWNTTTAISAADFDGPPLNVYTGGPSGTAPSLPFRCVY